MAGSDAFYRRRGDLRHRRTGCRTGDSGHAYVPAAGLRPGLGDQPLRELPCSDPHPRGGGHGRSARDRGRRGGAPWHRLPSRRDPGRLPSPGCGHAHRDARAHCGSNSGRNAGANSATHASANARGSSLAAPHAGPWAARRPRGARAVDVRRRLQQHVRDPSAIQPELAGHSLGQRHDALHFATNRLLLGLATAVARSRDEAPRAEHSL